MTKRNKFEISFVEDVEPDFVSRTKILFSGFHLTSLHTTGHSLDKQVWLLIHVSCEDLGTCTCKAPSNVEALIVPLAKRKSSAPNHECI